MRRSGQRAERKKQRLSSRKGSRSDRKESGSGTENAGREIGRQAPEDQLWERIREGRKETYRVAEYRNRERMHGKPGREERGRPQERKGERSTEEATVRRNREEKGKEETEAE